MTLFLMQLTRAFNSHPTTTCRSILVGPPNSPSLSIPTNRVHSFLSLPHSLRLLLIALSQGQALFCSASQGQALFDDCSLSQDYTFLALYYFIVSRGSLFPICSLSQDYTFFAQWYLLFVVRSGSLFFVLCQFNLYSLSYFLFAYSMYIMYLLFQMQKMMTFLFISFTSWTYKHPRFKLMCESLLV